MIQAWEDGRFRLIVSQPLIDEVNRNLIRLHLGGRVSQADLASLSLLLQMNVETTPLTVAVQGVATHPEDDLILATAISAGADCLVTGDRQLLALGTFRGIDIVTPSAFLAAIG